MSILTYHTCLPLRLMLPASGDVVVVTLGGTLYAAPTVSRFIPAWCIRVEFHHRHAASTDGDSRQPDPSLPDTLSLLCSLIADIHATQIQLRTRQLRATKPGSHAHEKCPTEC